MSTTEVMTPSTITRDLPADKEPETAYNWAKQTRREKVTVADVVKQNEGLRSQRSRKTKAAKSKREGA